MAKTKTNSKQFTPEMNLKRKRLIGAIFGVFKLLNKKPTMEYVKGIACRAAKVEDINDIPPQRLQSLYNAFLNAQKDPGFAQRLVNCELWDLENLN